MSKEVIVNRYIIHFLDKEQKSKITKLDLSMNVSKSDEFSTVLIEEIHNSINSSPSLKNTKFKDNHSNEFTNQFYDYLSLDNDEGFYKFSESIKVLDEKLKNEFLALGGYYLFIDYSFLGKKYISVVLLRKKNGINITKVGNIYKLDSSENLNIEKIAMACRVNYEIFSGADNRNYLALITTQQDGNISEYFKDWVCSGELIKNDKNTSNLIDIIRSIDIPTDTDDNGNRIYKTQNDFQKAVYDYARSRKSNLVNLMDLGTHFFGKEKSQILLEFAETNNIIIDPEFKRDSSKWKKLVTIRAKTEGIELNVDYDKINEVDVVIKDSIITINSVELAKQISKQFFDKNKEVDE